MTNTHPSLLHHFWTTDVWAASASSKTSQFVSSRVCPLLMDYFWNVCCKWKVLFIYFFFPKRRTSNTFFGFWLLIAESPVLEIFSIIVSQDSAGKRGEGDSAQPAWPSSLFLSQRYTQAWKEKCSRLSKKRWYLIHRPRHPLGEASLPYHGPPEAWTQVTILSLFSSQQRNSPLFLPHRCCE